jgi:hypothetical protein
MSLAVKFFKNGSFNLRLWVSCISFPFCLRSRDLHLVLLSLGVRLQEDGDGGLLE